MTRPNLISIALALAVVASAGRSAAADAPVTTMLAAVRQATVTIRLPGSDGEEAAVGAGFFEAATGLIVTNAHVVADRASVEIGTLDGRIAAASVLASDPVHDLAILSADLALPPKGLSFAGALPEVGTTVYGVGSPFGLGQSVTRGIVSALDRAIDATTPFGMIQHDAPLNPGSSGGPVVDESGAVIGINTAMPDGFRRDVGIAYAIPATIAAPIVARLAAEGSPPVRDLGISLRGLTPRLASAIGITVNAGVLVESVAPGSPAARAGLAPADLLVALGDQPTGALRDVAIALDKADPLAPLDAFVIRGTEHLTLTLPPADAPASPATAAHKRPDRPWVDATEIGFDLAENGSARVLAVGKGSAAGAAGIAVGDLILAVGRTPADSATQARRLIGAIVTQPFALLLADSLGSTRYVVVDPWSPGLDGDGLGGNMRHPRSARF